MKKLLLIGLVAGVFAFVPVQRSDAQVYFSVGFGGPGFYGGYYPYGNYYPYRYSYYRPYRYYGYHRPYYWNGGHRYYRHHRPYYNRYRYYR
jgi:hypothetical protein